MEPENPEVQTPEPHRLNQVTPLSKYLAMALFVSLPFIGGWIGYMYAPVEVVEVERVVVEEADIVELGPEEPWTPTLPIELKSYEHIDTYGGGGNEYLLKNEKQVVSYNRNTGEVKVLVGVDAISFEKIGYCNILKPTSSYFRDKDNIYVNGDSRSIGGEVIYIQSNVPEPFAMAKLKYIEASSFEYLGTLEAHSDVGFTTIAYDKNNLYSGCGSIVDGLKPYGNNSEVPPEIVEHNSLLIYDDYELIDYYDLSTFINN